MKNIAGALAVLASVAICTMTIMVFDRVASAVDASNGAAVERAAHLQKRLLRNGDMD